MWEAFIMLKPMYLKSMVVVFTLCAISLAASAIPDANSIAIDRMEKAVTNIKIVDENGVPIAGAVITIDGIASFNCHGSWITDLYGPAPEVTTNAQGSAEVSYPLYHYERIKTERLSFKVNHPEFCPARPFWRVDGKSAPVVLEKGATVKVSAYTGSKDNIVRDFFPQVSNRDVMLGMDYWRENVDGSITTKQLSAGPHYLRAIYFPKNDRVYFSDPVYFEAEKGKTYTFDLDVKPGVRVEGKLNDSVPRPITNGYIVARPYLADQKKEASSLYWQTSRDIKEDGTFAIESLPPGRVDIIAICDGFVSKDPNKPLAMIRNSQIFTLVGNMTPVEILMEPAAACKITVVDRKNNPIPNASVSFSPNVAWTGDGTQIFALRAFKSEDFFASGEKFDFSKAMRRNYFSATTDSNGVTIIKNLPPQEQDFYIAHPDYEMPTQKSSYDERREQKVNLFAGKTTSVTVAMQKKGTEMLGEKSLIASYWRKLCNMFRN